VRPTCRHCQRRKANPPVRGLCWRCRTTPEIAAQYPSTSPKCPGKFPQDLMPLLGIESDGFLAKRAGVHTSAVQALRKRRGIPSATERAREAERLVADGHVNLPQWWEGEAEKG
jgi:hypothetical protein